MTTRVDEAASDVGLWIARCLGRRDLALLSRDDVAAVSKAVESAPFSIGSVLLRQGEPPRSALIVRSGELELVYRQKRRRVTLGIAREAEVVGDVSVLCETPYTFSAVARSDGAALWVSADQLLRLLRRHPAVALRWLMSVIERMDRATLRLLEVTNLDLRDRVVSFIADELRAIGAVGGAAELPLSQATLASIVGASRQSVNKILHELREEGLLAAGYRRVRIPDVGAFIDHSR